MVRYTSKKWCDDMVLEVPQKKMKKKTTVDDWLDVEVHSETVHGHKGHKEECEIPFAHSFTPWQIYCQAFCPKEALAKGTLFPELWGVYPIPC